MQLPYINLPQSQAPQIIGDIGDTLVNAARRKQEMEQQAAQNLLQQQRLQAEQARMRAEESRAQAEEHRAAAAAERERHAYEYQQANATAEALPKIHEMLAAGDEGSANALAQARGIKLQQRPLATDPGAAPAAPVPGLAGPIPSPEERAMSFAGQPGDQGPAAEQAIGEDQALALQRQQYAQALADHPKLVAEHQAHVQAYQQAKQNPVYDIETPYGKSTFDLGAVRAAHQAKRAELANVLTQAVPAQYQPRMDALIKAGETPAKAMDSIQAQIKLDQTEAAKTAHDEKYDMTAAQKYQVGMAGAGSRGTAAAHADDRQARTQFHADIAKDASVIEKEFKTPYVESKKALRVVDTQPNNPEAWIAARDFFVKAASGGKVTKAQYDQAASHSAPAYDKLAQLFESATTGLPSETQRKNLHDALEAINKVAGQSLQDKQREFAATYGEDPLVASGDKTAAGTYERHAKRLFSETDEPKKKPVNPLTAAAKVAQLKPQDREAVQWAQANPNDPRSRAILERNGL